MDATTTKEVKMPEKKSILCVGLVCLDVVHVVKSYPEEDSDQRSIDQYTSRGGNASTDCTLLSQFGETCEYFGTLAEGTLELMAIERDFQRNKVHFHKCVRHEDKVCPKSCVIVNAENASRTIIHTNRDLPELTLEDFKTLDLGRYSWIQFEGRNQPNVLAILQYLKTNRPDITVGVEIEKPYRKIETFIPYGDYVFVSKDVARAHGVTNKEDALRKFQPMLRQGATIICPWGETGAAAMGPDGIIYTSPAYPPKNGVVDTLGAGDTFLSTMLGYLNRGKALPLALEAGCRVAGVKVGQRGYDKLRPYYDALL